MPVRIYEIARQVGCTSKEVLAKAKDLGITGARVPSSSLDKITAEYLVLQMKPAEEKDEPAVAETAETKVADPEPVVIVSEPEPEAEVETQPEPETSEATGETTGETDSNAEGQRQEAQDTSEVEIVEDAAHVESPQTESELASEKPSAEAEESTSQEPPKPPEETAPPTSSEEPPSENTQPETGEVKDLETEASEPEPEKASVATPPSGPRLGEKVGFIQLPTRPQRGRERPERKGGKTKKAAPQTGRGRDESRDRKSTGQEAPKSSKPSFVEPKDGKMITIKPPIIVRSLAEEIGRKPFQLIADLMELNVFANVNQAIEEDVAKRLCAKYGFRFETEKREKGAGFVAKKKKVQLDIEDREEDLEERAPVITIMGHVDHGKTTLIDKIRNANVAARESGGITQHIGAYTIQYPHPERPKEIHQITFLDTPGHAAFSAMRARGAEVTDIVILVIAANDGIMPQTVEAIDHARAAEVPIIVAVNKCDHPAADPLRARTQLQERGLQCEDWGGDIIVVDVSALKGDGIDKLLEMVLLQAEIMELKANPNRRAKGSVIESGLKQGGPVATVLVQKGMLKVGDAIICGDKWGKVRALVNEEKKRLKTAGPSVAVEILGLNGVPTAGDEFSVVENEKSARTLAEERKDKSKADELQARSKVTLENLFATLSEDSAKVLKVVVKADTQGSVEAIVDALKKIPSDKVSLEVIRHAVGTITESDVLLAAASNAIVLGFHTRVDGGVADSAKREGVQIKLYSIIYELIDEVRDAMSGLLDPVLKDVPVGKAEIRKVFELSKGGNVAGCVVTNGRMLKGRMRLLRDSNVLFEGFSQSLRRFQDEVNEVRSGMECGIRLDGFNDIREGDVIESYTVEKVAQKL